MLNFRMRCMMMWHFRMRQVMVWLIMMWSSFMVMLSKFSFVVLYFMSRSFMAEFMHGWVLMEVLMLMHMERMVKFSEHFM